MEEIIKFGNNGIEVKIEQGVDGVEDIWLDTEKIALLYGKERPAITKHLNNIYKNGEVSNDTFRSFDVITIKNGRKYKTAKKEYNLDVILSIGYKVNGKIGSEFRKWATQVLSGYLSKNEVHNLFSLTYEAKTCYNEGYIYIIKSQGLYKIGKTVDIRNRTRKYITENPEKIEITHYYKTSDYNKEEKRLHELFSKKRVRGEWFDLTDNDLNQIIKF